MSDSDKKTQDEKNSDKPVKRDDQYFDMYHFFSRKDVILAIILIVVVLLYLLYSVGPGAPTI